MNEWIFLSMYARNKPRAFRLHTFCSRDDVLCNNIPLTKCSLHCLVYTVGSQILQLIAEIDSFLRSRSTDAAGIGWNDSLWTAPSSTLWHPTTQQEVNVAHTSTFPSNMEAWSRVPGLMTSRVRDLDARTAHAGLAQRRRKNRTTAPRGGREAENGKYTENLHENTWLWRREAVLSPVKLNYGNNSATTPAREQFWSCQAE